MPTHSLWAATLVLVLAQACSAEKPVPRPPNIVFILIDDMGWRDLGCYGNTFHETPNIDRLATEGVRFTQAYAACPVCSPTRASIMTGKYPARLQLTDFIGGKRAPEGAPVLPADYRHELPLEENTLAEMLHAAGYATAQIGKWHLGGQGFGPLQQGFDEAAGGSGGGVGSFFWPAWKKSIPLEGHAENEYLTDRLTDEACAFVTAHKDKPFFLYLCHYAVHIPLDAKADKIAKYEQKLAANPAPESGHHNSDYAAMIESLDEGIGKLMGTLRSEGLEENTIVVFTSDNGGLSVQEGPKTPATTNAPLRMGKGYLYEGGLRVPCIIRWPGVAPAGAECNTAIISTDYFATFCAAAGLEAEAGANPPDSVSFLSLLKSPRSRPREARPLYWHYPHFSNQGGDPGGAVRVGDWKLVEFYGGSAALFNLKDDPEEQHDLSTEAPDKFAELQEMLRRWREETGATMPPPNPAFVRSE